MNKKRIIEKEILEYLDDLRESGDINMMGAGPYLQTKFNLSKQKAKEITIAYLFGNFEREEQ